MSTEPKDKTLVIETITWWKKISRPFSLSGERQEIVERNIREEAKGDFDFFTLSILSAIIVTLGLIINSAAVIIGGMLIAPLFWPILALSLGIVKGSVRLLETSFFTLAKVAVVILLISFLIGWLAPITQWDTEIISRTQPTLFELIIALVAGFAGAFIISYPKLEQAIAGVVIAAALVPPICVLGLSLAEQNLNAAGGSMLLFIANLIAVTVAASIYFLLAHFKTLQYSVSKERQRHNLLWSAAILLIIFIPLLIITGNTIQDYQRTSKVKKIMTMQLPNSELVDMNISQVDNVYYINTTIRSAQNISQYRMDLITDALTKALDSSVRLQVSIIPVLQGGKEIDNGNTNFLPNT
ncbi:MAG: TIGR00341 family protein [Candidatus Komeilibacteria bacterium]